MSFPVRTRLVSVAFSPRAAASERLLAFKIADVVDPEEQARERRVLLRIAASDRAPIGLIMLLVRWSLLTEKSLRSVVPDRLVEKVQSLGAGLELRDSGTHDLHGSPRACPACPRPRGRRSFDSWLSAACSVLDLGHLVLKVVVQLVPCR
jgi:hypothetical protein